MSDTDKGYDYRIELEDGVVVETNSMRFAAHVLFENEVGVLSEEDDHETIRERAEKVEKFLEALHAQYEGPDYVPMQVRRGGHESDEGRLHHLYEIFRLRAGNPDYDDAARSAYQEGADLVGDIIEGRSFP